MAPVVRVKMVCDEEENAFKPLLGKTTLTTKLKEEASNSNQGFVLVSHIVTFDLINS